MASLDLDSPSLNPNVRVAHVEVTNDVFTNRIQVAQDFPDDGQLPLCFEDTRTSNSFCNVEAHVHAYINARTRNAQTG